KSLAASRDFRKRKLHRTAIAHSHGLSGTRPDHYCSEVEGVGRYFHCNARHRAWLAYTRAAGHYNQSDYRQKDGEASDNGCCASCSGMEKIARVRTLQDWVMFHMHANCAMKYLFGTTG